MFTDTHASAARIHASGTWRGGREGHACLLTTPWSGTTHVEKTMRKLNTHATPDRAISSFLHARRDQEATIVNRAKLFFSRELVTDWYTP